MADYSTRRGGIRAKLPLQVLRGFSPTEPTGKLSSLAAPLTATDIKSGMVMVKDANGKYIPAVALDALFTENGGVGKSFYIALSDADALDVQASGSLVGLDCSDTFELQSGYFDKTVVWAVGDKLAAGDGGNLVKATAHATSAKAIIGEVTAIGTGLDSSGADIAGVGNPIPYIGFTPSCLAADAWMLQFKTIDQVVLPTTIA